MVKNVLKLCLFFLLSISYSQIAQEIESAEFIIEKDKELKLPKRERLFKRLSLNSAPTLATFDSLVFILKDIPFEIRSYNPNLKVATLKETTRPKDYDHLINIGYGAYNTAGILYEFGTHNLIGSNYGINIDLKKHEKGPVQANYSGESTSEVQLWHRANMSNGILFSSLDYGYDKFYNFGSFDQISTISSVKDTADHYLRRQHRFNLIFDYLAITKGKNQIRIMPEWHYTGQQGLSKNDNMSSYYSGGEENDFALNFNLDAVEKKFWVFKFHSYIGYAQFNNKRFENNQRFWTFGIPKIAVAFNDLSVSAGFKIGFFDDAEEGKSGFILPDLTASYVFGNDFSVYGEIKGDIIRNDFKNLTNQNRHISDSVLLKTSIEPIGLKLGVSGVILPRITYDINISAKLINNQMYFINNKYDPSFFDLVYDQGKSSWFNMQSYLNFDATNQITCFATVKFNEIRTNTIEMPWHIPSASFQIGSKFKLINDRLIFAPFLVNLSNLKALSAEEKIISLANVMDFGMDINTSINEKISSFLKIRNILGKENQIYNLYSSREFDIYGGISVRF